MNISEIQKIFLTIVRNFRCPICGKRYSYENIHVISLSGSICFLQLECFGHMPMMASVSIVGNNTFQSHHTPITADEVIDSFERLKRAKNLSQLFEK